MENLPRAIGLIQGLLFIKEMKDFNKEGLVSTLEEILQILKTEKEKKLEDAKR